RHAPGHVVHPDRPVVRIELQVRAPGHVENEAHAPGVTLARRRPGRADRRPRGHHLDLPGQRRRIVLRRTLGLNPGVYLDAAAVPSRDGDATVLARVDRDGPSRHQGDDADLTVLR